MGFMARGRLRLSLRPSPRPRPILTSFMEDLDTTDMPDTLDMPDSDTEDTESMARGLLMLRLSRILTTPDTMDLDMPDSDTADTTSANRLHQDLSVNHRQNLGQKWIVISLKFPLPVLQFQCYHTKSVVMVSRKQENQSGKNPAIIKIA